MADESITGGERTDLGPLSAWASELADTFVSLASDIALVVRPDGVVDAVRHGASEDALRIGEDWVGRPWVETVTSDTRGKVERLLDEVRQTGRSRRREVNHPGPERDQVPVAYTAIELGRGGPVLVVGRDLRDVASIQQRFLDAQRDLEQGYWQAKQLDARYQLLFEAATDGVMLVRARDLEVVECNDAAAGLLGRPTEQIIGSPVGAGFDPVSQPALRSLLSVAAGSGEAREVTARFTSHAGLVSVAVRPLALKRELVFALRLRLSDNDISADQLEAAISRLLHDSDDCVAVTDAAGHIVVCNQAFVRLLRLTSQEAAVGRPIVDWLSVEGGSWAELRDDLRGRGVMRDLPGQVVQQTAAVAAVQVTATLLLEGDQERIGFRLHAEPAEATPGDSFRRELEELSARIGEACLSDLLEHAEHAVERYLTRRAMEIAKGDAVSAARVLGVDPERVLRAYAPEPGSDE